jgi:signal recognition particle subunit SEC65
VVIRSYVDEGIHKSIVFPLMTDKKAYEADTPRKTHAVKRKLIMDIEDLVEEAFPNDLHEQSFVYTRLFNNINARVIHERNYGDDTSTT